MIPKLTRMRLGVTQACSRFPPVYPLAISYPYTATVSETGIEVCFLDFPNDVSWHNVYESVPVVVHRALSNIMRRFFEAEQMIPLPSKAEGERASVPEEFALEILRRNWAIAQVYAEARQRFDQQQREVIRKAAKHKGRQHDSDPAEAI